MAVERDFVACGCDLGSKRRVALDLLTDEEKRGDAVAACEVFEHRWGTLGVWPVVKRERDARSTESSPDTKGAGDSRNKRSRRRGAPGERPGSKSCQTDRSDRQLASRR